MKRYLIILVALSIVFSFPFTVFAENNTTPNVIKLNLDQAYASLEANNLELKLMDKKIEISQLQYDDAAEKGIDAKSMVSSNGDTNLQYRKQQTLNPQLAMLDLNTARNDRAEKLKSLKSDVKQQYINILFLQNEKEYINEDMLSVNKQLEETTLRVKLGQATEASYKSIYSQKLSIQNQFNSLDTQLQTALINFKKTVGIVLSQPIELEDLVLPSQALDTANIKEDILNAIDKDFSIQASKTQLELKQLELKLVKDNTDYKYSLDYIDLNTEISELEAELNYAKLNLEAELWTDYYNLSGLEDDIKLAEINVEIEKINYDTIAAKTKLGMVNSMAEMDAKTAYNRAKNDWQRAMYNYSLAVEQYNEKLNR